MNKIGEFFDKLEKMLEDKKRSRMKKGMGVYTGMKIAGVFAGVGIDLLVLIGWVTGTGADLFVDYRCIIPLAVIGYIAMEICCHYLNKRIKAQKTEELAEDLEDDIARIAYTIAIVAIITAYILVWLIYYK